MKGNYITMFVLGPDLEKLGVTDKMHLFNKEEMEQDERYSPNENGYSEAELWALDYTLALFLYPRLKAFRKMNKSYPYRLTPESWDEIVSKMERAFELIIIEDVQVVSLTDEEYEEINEGLDLFREFFFDLWS